MCCFLFVNSTNCLACDMVLNAKEENYLFCYNSIKNACQGSDYKNASCSKYLVRYDGLASKIDEIKKIADEKDSKKEGLLQDIIDAMKKILDEKDCKNNEGLLEDIRKLIFGEKISEIRKYEEKEAYKKILNEFYKQVKERKFEGNNILMYCIDSTDVNNIKSNLKFEHTFSNLGRYPNDIEDYFKEWLK